MSAYKSDLVRVLSERGFIHATSEGLDERALTPLAGYIGFDCTAPSFHVGSLVQIMMLRWMQKTGHKPIVLMGGGTTRVGDPSGKDESRRVLTYEQIDANKASLRQTFARFLSFDASPSGAVMADNAEWLAPLNYIDFLREVGRHFSVNRMLSMDSVKLRLDREHELSFLEFNYMVLQAYDFVELARRYDCVLQLGGSDQWGNIVQGIDLGRRLGTPQLYALTSPLITTSSGAKMGKTAAGAVWLSAELLSPYEYWQFWRNTEDADVGRFLKLFTELNDAKKVLANEATALLHGKAAAEEAAEAARRTFEEGGAAAALPTIEIAAADFAPGLPVTTLFVRAGLAASNGEVRRAIANNALSVNDTRVTDPAALIGPAELIGGIVKLSHGRKKHVLVKAT